MTLPIGKGARVRLLRQLDDPWTKLIPGDEGTVTGIEDITEIAGLPFHSNLRQIWVKWDNKKSSMALLEGKDDDYFEYWFPYNGNNKK